MTAKSDGNIRRNDEQKVRRDKSDNFEGSWGDYTCCGGL